MSKLVFCSDVEQGKAIASLELISEAYKAVSDTTKPYQLYHTRSGIDVLAFNSFTRYTAPLLKGEFDLVSSEDFEALAFISGKANTSFAINGAAVELFKMLDDDLKNCLNEHVYKPLVITGSGVGGYLAILSTLFLHCSIEEEEYSKGAKNTKRPYCITFGCPLVGNEALQKVIAERPLWKSSFLNVVAKEDRVASILSANTAYKPFGMFLFCAESGGHAAFEHQDSILLVLNAMNTLQNGGNLAAYDYAAVLSLLRRKLLQRGGGECNLNPLRAGITLQLREIGVLDCISVDQIDQMEKTQRKMIKDKNVQNAYDESKKLNDSKISMTFMEWHMKSRTKGGGYYAFQKAEETRDDIKARNEIAKHHRRLNQYWETTVEKKERVPQKENAKLRTRWLLGGTNYRRIVEPLDIAQHYKKGNTNYMEARHDHYVKLERWLDEYMKGSREETRDKAASLTVDSCFYAYVEEASISLRKLVEGDVSDDWEQKLKQFGVYVMGEISKFAVSPDVFLEGSIMMKWWNEYNAYKETEYHSQFADYMKEKTYQSYK